jgi:hypothetical protein
MTQFAMIVVDYTWMSTFLKAIGGGWVALSAYRAAARYFR